MYLDVWATQICSLSLLVYLAVWASRVPVFWRRFRDPIWVPRIENRVPKIRGNYQRVSRIREIVSLQIHTGYLTFSLKKTLRVL